MTNFAYIVAAKRSAVIPKSGHFSHLAIHELAAPIITSCLQSAKIPPDKVSELILSNAVGAGGNPARLAALAAGLPDRIGGLSIDRQCTGGLDAIWLAAQMVMSGVHDVIIAGGVESASRRPIRMHNLPNSDPIPYDRPDFTGLAGRDPDMVDAVAHQADQMNIDKQAQTDWAIHSHAKALKADFSAEITSICDQTRDTFARTLTEKICARAPVLSGTITTATTAVNADAAACVIVVNEQIAKSYPNAIRIRTGAMLGGVPDQPAMAPLSAIQSVLDASQTLAQNLKSVEIMEAYAAQAIIAAQSQPFDPVAINKGGGALSRGHPIGASGAILAVRLYHELQKTRGSGLAAIAAAGGLGSAILLQA